MKPNYKKVVEDFAAMIGKKRRIFRVAGHFCSALRELLKNGATNVRKCFKKFNLQIYPPTKTVEILKKPRAVFHLPSVRLHCENPV